MALSFRTETSPSQNETIPTACTSLTPTLQMMKKMMSAVPSARGSQKTSSSSPVIITCASSALLWTWKIRQPRTRTLSRPSSASTVKALLFWIQKVQLSSLKLPSRSWSLKRAKVAKMPHKLVIINNFRLISEGPLLMGNNMEGINKLIWVIEEQVANDLRNSRQTRSKILKVWISRIDLCATFAKITLKKKWRTSATGAWQPLCALNVSFMELIRDIMSHF